MTSDNFKAILSQYDFQTLGLNFKTLDRIETNSVVTPNHPNISYRAFYENKLIKFEIDFFTQAEDLSIWFIKSQEEYFTLSEYLKHKNREIELARLERVPGETTEQYITRYLDYTIGLLKTDLKPVIDGQWEEISRDWMGYK